MNKACLTAAEEELQTVRQLPLQYREAFTPLSARIKAESPELLPQLMQLQEVIGDADFQRYIESLAALRKHEERLLLITRKEMHRSILESRYVPVLQTVFQAKLVRIVSQP